MSQKEGCDMEKKQPDKEFAKLKYKQALEGMRHVQRLEATEIGFAAVAYAVVIAGLLNAAEGRLGRLTARWLAVLSILAAGTLVYHFWRRRASYYRHVRRLEEGLAALGEPCEIKHSWAGLSIRVAIIVILTVAVLLLGGVLGP